MGLSKRQQEIKSMLKGLISQMELIIDTNFGIDEPFYSVYAGSYMSLDPCGRYHHGLSPNCVTNNCNKFWDSVDKVAELLGGWIEGGEGDPTDIYFCMSADAYEKLKSKKNRKAVI